VVEGGTVEVRERGKKTLKIIEKKLVYIKYFLYIYYVNE